MAWADRFCRSTDIRLHPCSLVSAGGVIGHGPFVPKPSSRTDSQRCGIPDLGSIVRGRPLASTAGDGDGYSLGYSAVWCWGTQRARRPAPRPQHRGMNRAQ
jgi:hypothetical protein